MHLRSISMKGFKSFPQRTKLEFGTGVSVVVGPNGSGKSNITDAVLWALGEQSPLAVRGQVMKDVIFAGAQGVGGSSAAEVEVVIDNSDGRLDSGFSEISIVRRLDRDGEGEYRLNGGRCRLVDVIEVLSDSGLGKEMHSVVSQGKVEQIVMSRPRERRLLIEEAAGLGKHRKRRRRAQLKLERTEENLSRALDVEREARSRLRPLKRQAEAAELHERLERQTLEALYALSRDAVRAARAALAEAEGRAQAAGTERDEAERLLAGVARRREQAEEAFAAQTRDREQLQGRVFAARAAADRVAMRGERVREQAVAAEERRERRLHQLELLEQQAAVDREQSAEQEGPEQRIAALGDRTGGTRRRPRGPPDPRAGRAGGRAGRGARAVREPRGGHGQSAATELAEAEHRGRHRAQRVARGGAHRRVGPGPRGPSGVGARRGQPVPARGLAAARRRPSAGREPARVAGLRGGAGGRPRISPDRRGRHRSRRGRAAARGRRPQRRQRPRPERDRRGRRARRRTAVPGPGGSRAAARPRAARSGRQGPGGASARRRPRGRHARHARPRVPAGGGHTLGPALRRAHGGAVAGPRRRKRASARGARPARRARPRVGGRRRGGGRRATRGGGRRGGRERRRRRARAGRGGGAAGGARDGRGRGGGPARRVVDRPQARGARRRPRGGAARRAHGRPPGRAAHGRANRA